MNLIGEKIEQSFGYPMDVEWTYDPKENLFYIFQARPIPDRQEADVYDVNIKALRESGNRDLVKVKVVVSSPSVSLALTDDNCLVAADAVSAKELPCSFSAGGHLKSSATAKAEGE